MPFKKKYRSPSTTPVPSTELAPGAGAHIPKATWEGMKRMLDAIYDYRSEDGFDPSKLFQRLVNKRILPDYYEAIKEPVALSTIKLRITRREYRSFAAFVRDFALIPHNAQVFNRPDSGAFQDALVIKAQIQRELQKLVDERLVSADQIVLPDLGEIPTYEDVPMEEVPAEEEDSDDEGEEDDEDEDEEEETDGRKKRRGRPAGTSKRDGVDDDGRKTRKGRPPKLLTPMESRIQAILKGVRKLKDTHSQLMIKDFDRMPDKQALPDYYQEIKNPMAYDLLKRKVKRKKYKTLEEFMADMNLMFNNAKAYNKDDSVIFQHAVKLQVEAGRLYDVWKAKSDADFADDEGKIPVPDGLLHNGELYKVGDWVHLQNANDLTKPVPAQIYRTYRNPDGQGMVNVCWYYRPEQTVHRFDKHFMSNEVVKTGRYRDHRIEEIEGKCFIMFTTRYFKGRPRGLPKGQEVYVCEARYNEERAQFNKIKTWASCLPDEVRDRDYEMDLFDHTRKMKKYPSPIAYLMKDDQKETDELPKPTWGAEGAPPKIGAVHKRPRGDKDSPPPEPTPPPPPKRPTPPPRVYQPLTQTFAPSPATANSNSTTRYPPSLAKQPSSTYTPQQYSQQSLASPAQRPPPTSNYATPSQPLARSTQPQYPHTAPPPPAPSIPRPPSSLQNPASYRDPPPIEVYVLPELANASIPSEVRERYSCDEEGRVLWFCVPPQQQSPLGSAAGPGPGLGKSVRYLAEKARREGRKRAHADDDSEVGRGAKKTRSEGSGVDVEALKVKALEVLERQLADATGGTLRTRDLARLEKAQRAVLRQHAEVEARTRQREEMRRLGDGGVFADDWDVRVS
nr:hypothetical protein B0A51_11484 [Rachicladosporium sp. CCFEE 5018]